MLTLVLSNNKIHSTSSDAFLMHEKSSFGEKKGKNIEYSFIESLFLIDEKRAIIFQKKKELSFEDLMKKAIKIDKKIDTKFVVFKDLRRKGYILKTALKFGAEFRVYDKGHKPGTNHSKWIIFTTRESEKINWHEFAAKNRVAHSTKKNLLLGIVDEEDSVSYFEISWIRP